MSFDPKKPKENDLLVLQKNVRMGAMPNSPLLLKYYLSMTPLKNEALKEKRRHYEDQYRLLIDTISDDCVTGHWRCLCLDHIYFPLKALQELADSPSSRKHVTALYTELRVISSYFQVSMTNKQSQ